MFVLFLAISSIVGPQVFTKEVSIKTDALKVLPVAKDFGATTAFFDFDESTVYLSSSRALLVLDVTGHLLLSDTFQPKWLPKGSVRFVPHLANLSRGKVSAQEPSSGFSTRITVGPLARKGLISVIGERELNGVPFRTELTSVSMHATGNHSLGSLLLASGKSGQVYPIAVFGSMDRPGMVLASRELQAEAIRLDCVTFSGGKWNRLPAGMWPRRARVLNANLRTLNAGMRKNRVKQWRITSLDMLSGRCLIGPTGGWYAEWYEFDPATTSLRRLPNAGRAKGMLPFYASGRLLANSSSKIANYYADQDTQLYSYSRRSKGWTKLGVEMPLGSDASGQRWVVKDMVSGTLWIAKLNKSALRALD